MKRPPSSSLHLSPPVDRLVSSEILARHLRQLLRLDPRLKAVNKVAGSFPPRMATPGFAGLARIVCGQQLSGASADAIWGRLEARLGATTAKGFLALGEKGLKGVGLSGSKFRTITGVAQAVVAGELDFSAVAGLPAEEAIAEFTKLKGIGPWTAEIYLMFCAGHPDVFPAGDLALQKGVGEAFGLDPHPDRPALIAIAAGWSPHRSTAALLFWRYYSARRQRETTPL